MKVYPFRCAKCGGHRFFLLIGTAYCWVCERPQGGTDAN